MNSDAKHAFIHTEDQQITFLLDQLYVHHRGPLSTFEVGYSNILVSCSFQSITEFLNRTIILSKVVKQLSQIKARTGYINDIVLY